MRRGGKSLKKMKERAAQRRLDLIPHWLYTQEWETNIEPLGKYFKSHNGRYIYRCKCSYCQHHRLLKKKIDDIRFKEQKEDLNG